jgi:hypothetical protein
LEHRRKGHPELDTPQNIEWLCEFCHKYSNGRKHREEFWERQCQRFGERIMREWLDGLPIKVKQRF